LDSVHRFREQKRAKALLIVVALAVAAASAVTIRSHPASAVGAGSDWPIDTYGLPRSDDNVILKWNEQLLSVIRSDPKDTGPTVTARALGVANTAMYDAWAAYDPVAVGTRLGGSLRRPAAEQTLANKNKAISVAAYKVLNDLFPDATFHAKANLDGQMSSLGYATDGSDTSTAATVGNTAAQAVIDFRHADGANQLGDDPAGTLGVPYSDTTGYHAVNTWDTMVDPWRWQPLCVPIVTSGTPCPSTSAIQKPLTPQWKNITPFTDLDPATHYPTLFELPGPPKLADGSYDPTDIDTALSDTSNLTDAQKMKAEYWADGPKSEFPPGHMAVFAQALSRMRKDTLDQDVKLFFTLGNALMDSSISAWAAKYQYDFVRPVTAIRERYKNQLITSWLGPGKGYGKVLGQNWLPYQALNVVTPAFPEYVSGHSTFSAAGRTVMLAFYGTDNFGAKVTIKAGSSKIEPGITPAKDVVLSWKTLTAAADEAGWSRRYGGIHFQSGDEQGRALGKLIGYNAWTKAQTYFNGTASAPA
jgi:hypothetical protein